MVDQIIKKLEAEHQDIYKELERLMLELAKVKKDVDHKHLQKTCSKLLVYVANLLDKHFLLEETELFPELYKKNLDKELLDRLVEDHKEIEEKYDNLNKKYEEFTKRLLQNYFTDYDYKTEVLFPAYNLVATINHHASREDSFFNKALI